MLGHDPTASTSENYRRFAALEARGTSPLYEHICAGISADRELLGFLGELPPRCRQPNLLLGVVRYAFGVQPTYGAFRETVLGHREQVADLLLRRRTQTNEPGRCAALLPILAALPQPLALLEVGTSAGLCLLPDRYGYRYGEHVLPGGPPVMDCRLVGDVSPPLPTRLPEVVWRKGIDIAPLDVSDPDDVRWLESLVWPGQTDRERHLRESLVVAREDPPEIVQGDLVDLLGEVASGAPADATLVVFHTAVLGYLPVERRVEFASRVAALGATWIASEAPGILGVPARPGALRERGHFVVTVGGGEPVARMGPHGDWLEWSALAQEP
ncbi:MAG: hypothetical protein QOG77_2949 [Solirubrobacteraceae bacterium]|nr:hypothetical protein [Solirubrobacteraceae bacterium]